MKAVVIGGAGFLGSHIIDRLLREGIEVLCVDRPGCNTTYLDQIKVPIAYGNITDKESIKVHIHEGDMVFHVAALLAAASTKWSAFQLVNVDGTKNVLEAAIERKAKTFLFMSTYGVYGPHGSLDHPLTEITELDPHSYYDKSKFLAEKYIEERALRENICCIIFRAPVIFGPRANRISGTSILFTSLKRGLFATFGNGRQKFPICYVKNLANAFVYFAGKHEEGIHVYNMGNYPEVTFEEFISEVRKHYRFIIVKIPAWIGLSLAEVSEFFSKRLKTISIIPKNFILGLVSDAYHSSIEKALKAGYREEYSIADGIRETMEFLNMQK